MVKDFYRRGDKKLKMTSQARTMYVCRSSVIAVFNTAPRLLDILLRNYVCLPEPVAVRGFNLSLNRDRTEFE